MLLSCPYIKFPIEKKKYIFVILFTGENIDGLTVRFVCAWQNRGSGRSFDSFSGYYNWI